MFSALEFAFAVAYGLRRSCSREIRTGARSILPLLLLVDCSFPSTPADNAATPSTSRHEGILVWSPSSAPPVDARHVLRYEPFVRDEEPKNGLMAPVLLCALRCSADCSSWMKSARWRASVSHRTSALRPHCWTQSSSPWCSTAKSSALRVEDAVICLATEKESRRTVWYSAKQHVPWIGLLAGLASIAATMASMLPAAATALAPSLERLAMWPSAEHPQRTASSRSVLKRSAIASATAPPASMTAAVV
mmetsp:Transcript_17945/g.38803  ORF Transcript_17945/g.38803 Transcript_17945/m.38803 type:complete len:249 (+) Transcript_17945:576-1322(+)